MKKIINMVPHEIRILERNSKRILSTYSPAIAEPKDVPEAKPGVVFIVPKAMAETNPLRDDLLFVTYPDDLVYDDQGTPLGYWCFSTIENVVE